MLDYVTRTRALELFNAGVGYKAASRALNLPIYTVREWLRRYKRGDIAFFDKDYIVPVYRTFDEETMKKARVLFEQGLSLKQIARRLKTTPQSVRKWIKEVPKK